MPMPKGGSPPGFARAWKGPSKSAFVDNHYRYSSDFLPPAVSAYARTPVPVTTSSLAGANGTNAVITLPTGIVKDDVVVFGLYRESAATVAPPSGYTSKQIVDCTGSHIHQQQIFWHRATGAESGTITTGTWTGSAWREAWAVRFSGCRLVGDPFDTVLNFATSNSVGSTNATPDVASLTPTLDNCLICFSGTNWNAGGWTPPSGFTEQVDIGGAITIATNPQAAAMPTGIVSANAVTADVGRTGLVFALAPVDLGFEGWGVPL